MGEEFVNLAEFKGGDLVGLQYEPMFPYFKDNQNSFIVLHGDFVSTEDGTGVVHCAPAFGEDDNILCKENKIKTVCPVDEKGKFTIDKKIKYTLAEKEEELDLFGFQVFDKNVDIIKYLKANNLWIFTEQYNHNYPHCWRTDTPLIYKSVSSWFLEVEKIRDRMVELNKEINWFPVHIKEGHFGKWIENARSWCISRNRFWGCPIPVWKSENPDNKELYVFGSIKELEEFFGQKVESLHLPHIDKLTKEDPINPKFKIKRVPDVLDCWFESGSMPFAQMHYPFENKEFFEDNFPADFIVEYLAQTRGWFYTLLVLSTALFDKIPFKNCLCHGVILDQKGQKLSKRLNNYPDPTEMFDKFGSDAVRWSIARSNLLKGEDIKISMEGKEFEDSINKIIQPLKNAFNFYKLYSEIDKIKLNFEDFKDFSIHSLESQNFFDKYILSCLYDFSSKYHKNMAIFDAQAATVLAEGFLDTLNNWYIRRNKNRFWKSENDSDKMDAYKTLFFAINVIIRDLSPLLPFTTEEINLVISEESH